MKKKLSSDLLVTIGLGVLTVGQFILSSKKQKHDLQDVKNEVLKDVMDQLSKDKQ